MVDFYYIYSEYYIYGYYIYGWYKRLSNIRLICLTVKTVFLIWLVITVWVSIASVLQRSYLITTATQEKAFIVNLGKMSYTCMWSMQFIVIDV